MATSSGRSTPCPRGSRPGRSSASWCRCTSWPASCSSGAGGPHLVARLRTTTTTSTASTSRSRCTAAPSSRSAGRCSGAAPRGLAVPNDADDPVARRRGGPARGSTRSVPVVVGVPLRRRRRRRVRIITANGPRSRGATSSSSSVRDVIHSFWIPQLQGKLDAVPGRTHALVLDAEEPGLYEGQCTEYCGLSHGVMRMQVKALPQEEFDEWLELMQTPPEQPTDPLALAGQELFVSQCTMCHQIDGILPGDTAPFEYSGAGPETTARRSTPTLREERSNLTHFMMRQRFRRRPARPLRGRPGPVGPPVRRMRSRTSTTSKRWLRDPLGVKPMNGQQPGNARLCGLTEGQIDRSRRSS